MKKNTILLYILHFGYLFTAFLEGQLYCVVITLLYLTVPTKQPLTLTTSHVPHTQSTKRQCYVSLALLLLYF